MSITVAIGNTSQSKTSSKVTLNATVQITSGDYPEGINTIGAVWKAGSSGDPTVSDNVAWTVEGWSASDKSVHNVSPYTSTLSAGTTYRLAVVATHGGDYTYGATVTVKTVSVAPTVQTNAASAISYLAFTANGNISVTGDEDGVGSRGFCYKEGTSGDPTLSDSYVIDSGPFGAGAFSKAITGLKENTSYRVRAFAGSMVVGYGYGSTITVTTLSGRKLVAASGSILLSGSAVALMAEGVIAVASGSLSLSGSSVTMYKDLCPSQYQPKLSFRGALGL